MPERIIAQVQNVTPRKKGASLTANVALGATSINVDLVDGVFNADTGQLIIGTDVYTYTVPEYLATIAPQSDLTAPAPVAGEEDPPEPEKTYSGTLNISPNAVRAYNAEDKVYVYPIVEEHVALVIEPGSTEDLEAIIDHSLYARLPDGPRSETARDTVTCEYRPQGLTVIDILGTTPIEDLNHLLLTTDPSQTGERVDIQYDGIREYEADGVTVAVSLLEAKGLDMLAGLGLFAPVTRMLRWLNAAGVSAARVLGVEDNSGNRTMYTYTTQNDGASVASGIIAYAPATGVGYVTVSAGNVLGALFQKVLLYSDGTSDFEFASSGGWHSWTPTMTGWSANPTGGVYRWKQVGQMVHLAIHQPNTGTSNATSKTLSLPAAAAGVTNMVWSGAAAITDNGAAQTTPGRGVIQFNGTTIAFGKDWSLGAFTASGAASIRECFVTYEAA